jgi:hypothetical protein
MKNFTLRENVSHLEHTSKSESFVKSPKIETVNAILAYSKSLKIEKSDLLNKQVSINLN